jgi:hypothetical protein
MVRAVAPVPPPPVAEKGDLQLDGIYFQIQSLAIGGQVRFIYIYKYFLPDGHVYEGMPPGGAVKPNPTAEDIAALSKASANHFGVYKITGDQLVIQRGAETVKHSFALQKGGDLNAIVFDGLFATRLLQFKDNQTLDGKYATTFSYAGGGRDRFAFSSVTSITFHPDGTFSGASLSGSSSRNNQGDLNRTSDSGTYRASWNTLTLTHADGKVEQMTAAPMFEKDTPTPQRLNLNGVMYELQK